MTVSYLLSHALDDSASLDPERLSFVVPNASLTYGELAIASSRLANVLRESGVRAGDRVGIWMPRCLETAVAVYGILKAGAAFVPIDPHAPVGGAARVIDSCGVTHIVTRHLPADRLAELGTRSSRLAVAVGPSGTCDGVRTIDWEALTDAPCEAPPLSITDRDIAYIMFSSGSTGRPKGIVHTHASGLAYARLSGATYGVRPDDRLANHSPLHFDMSTMGYFTAPVAGATTVIVPEAYTKMAASLTQLMEDTGVTIWYSVPLALVQMLERGVLESRDLRAVRWVLFGGEPFPVKHLRTLMDRWPHARFSNVYGPAEVNQCTYYHVPPLGPDHDDRDPIPIGRVWANAEGMVVDGSDAPVGPGQSGELLVRSSTMMRGYWDRAELNGAAYLRRPTASGDDDVFYRTGDLVRVREDGELVFLGRKDRQLKVRGYRVELDEVEHALVANEGVLEAAAYRVRGSHGDQIEAAVVVSAGESCDPEGLRSFVGDVLSWYAVPSRIIVMESFPRTGTGKIDRRRLQLVAEENVVS